MADGTSIAASLGFAKQWLEKNKDDLVAKVLSFVPQPKDGRGIVATKALFNGVIQFDFSDGTSEHVGPFVGPRGPQGPSVKGDPGSQGPEGPKGVGFNTRGSWQRGTTYFGPSDEYPYIDWVTHKGSSWYAADPNGVADEPGRGTGWGVLAAKGKQGTDGSGAYGGVAQNTVVTFSGAQEMAYTVRIDFVSDSAMYRGEADPGASESDAKWRIKYVTFGADGDVTELWAGGTADFNKVWADRLTLTYM